jgi:NhaP-type Na+/H+ or K+/H+ antiporter
MAVSVGLVAAFAYYLLGLPLGAGVLLGAILAPTDPVLATDVQTRHPGDRDRLRFTLTCEAGMNDGTAFPFAMLGMGLLGLHGLGEFGVRWGLVDVLWTTVAGVAIGVMSGAALAYLGRQLRGNPPRHKLMDDFLGLGLIGVVYGLSVLVDAGGFLAVFFAAVALRQTELKLAHADMNSAALDNPDRLQTSLNEPGAENPSPENDPPPTVSGGSLIFKEHLERLSELMLILLIGGTLFIDSWSWRAVGLALFLFMVARPLSVLVGMAGTRTLWPMRGMVGWFGVRGIGSLYYLVYAIQHGLPEDLALSLIQLTLIAVTLSILVHGISVKPLMGLFLYRKRLPKP